MTEKKFTLDVAHKLLEEKFAPWVQELGMRFESLDKGDVFVRVPASERLNREGGTVCGQAIMAVADTAMVFSISSFLDEFVPMTTVSQSSSFLRPAADKDLMAHARIIKPGRSIMYGEVNLFTDSPEKPVAHITSTYMLL